MLCMAAMLSAGAVQAQMDLGGVWSQIAQQSYDTVGRGNGPFPDDFAGIPLNKDGRAAALAYDPEALEQLHRQCQPYLAHYLLLGPFGFQASAVRDPTSGTVVAWQIDGTLDRLPMRIWVDGRAAPPEEARHTFSGFTTGVWRGATLVTTTTHLKDGFLTRNGVPSSSQETLRMFWTRHAAQMSITAIIHDPVYLTAAYPWAETYQLVTNGAPYRFASGMQCAPEEIVPSLSDGYHTSAYLPGKNPLVDYMSKQYGIPADAAMGGAQTMLPGFQRQLHARYRRPSGYCTQYCCGSEGVGAAAGNDYEPPTCKTGG